MGNLFVPVVSSAVYRHFTCTPQAKYQNDLFEILIPALRIACTEYTDTYGKSLYTKVTNAYDA